MITNMIFLSILVCFIVGILRIPTKIIDFLIVRVYGYSVASTRKMIKPWECLLCMTWWSNFIYMWITGGWSIVGFGMSALLAFYADTITEFMLFSKDFIANIMSKLTDKYDNN